MSSNFRVSVNNPLLRVVYDKKGLRRVLRQAGAEVSNLAKTKIRASGGGRTYRGSGGASAVRPYMKGKHVASVAGNAPASFTRSLIRSIRVRPFKSGEGVAVRASIFYAKMLEGGAHGGGNPGPRMPINPKTGKRKRARGVLMQRILAPRPFLSTSLAEKSSSLGTRIRAAVNQGVAFKRTK